MKGRVSDLNGSQLEYLVYSVLKEPGALTDFMHIVRDGLTAWILLEILKRRRYHRQGSAQIVVYPAVHFEFGLGGFLVLHLPGNLVSYGDQPEKKYDDAESQARQEILPGKRQCDRDGQG